jgi:Fe-S cluster assembly iron-binding protein IscA
VRAPPLHAQPKLTPPAVLQRLKELQAETPDTPILLRVEVEGGGCSGFQYKFSLEHEPKPEDQ